MAGLRRRRPGRRPSSHHRAARRQLVGEAMARSAAHRGCPTSARRTAGGAPTKVTPFPVVRRVRLRPQVPLILTDHLPRRWHTRMSITMTFRCHVRHGRKLGRSGCGTTAAGLCDGPRAVRIRCSGTYELRPSEDVPEARCGDGEDLAGTLIRPRHSAPARPADAAARLQVATASGRAQATGCKVTGGMTCCHIEPLSVARRTPAGRHRSVTEADDGGPGNGDAVE